MFSKILKVLVLATIMPILGLSIIRSFGNSASCGAQFDDILFIHQEDNRALYTQSMGITVRVSPDSFGTFAMVSETNVLLGMEFNRAGESVLDFEIINTDTLDSFTYILSPSVSVWNYSLSTDGSVFAYIVSSWSTFEADLIYLVDIESHETRLITNQLRQISAISISPDNRYILATMRMEGNTQEFYSIDLQTGEIENLLGLSSALVYSWSPGGRFIATYEYVPIGEGGQTFLSIYEFETGNVQRYAIEIASKPVWSPDGRYVAFNIDDGVDIGISFFDMATSQISVLIDDPIFDEHIGVWSPRGDQLSFITWSSVTGEIENLAINIETGETCTLVQNGRVVYWK